jgi:hypothetical protein
VKSVERETSFPARFSKDCFWKILGYQASRPMPAVLQEDRRPAPWNNVMAAALDWEKVAAM